MIQNRSFEFDSLPEAAQEEIARLEVELYDTRSEMLHVYAALQVLIGAACIAFGSFGRIGSFIYTGSSTITWLGGLFVVLGTIHYVRKDRQNRQIL